MSFIVTNAFTCMLGGLYGSIYGNYMGLYYAILLAFAWHRTFANIIPEPLIRPRILKLCDRSIGTATFHPSFDG